MDLICKNFQIGHDATKAHKGKVLVDEQNLYLLIGLNLGSFVAGGIGGALAGAVVGTAANLLGKKTLTQETQTTFGELPQAIRSQPAWGRPKDKARVIVLPKGAVRSVKCSALFGCTVKTDATTFKMSVSFLTIGRTRKLFQKYGWPTA